MERKGGRLTGMQGIIDLATDGPPVDVVNADGKSDIVLVCEHASNRVPQSLNDLGLSASELQSHFAWDPGAIEVAKSMSRRLDAPLIMARFSRLVYDCNRPPAADSAILDRSETFDIPGNKDLTDADREARLREVYTPFREQVAEVLSAKSGRSGAPILVTVHTFTPVYAGDRRNVDLGVLHDTDRRLADEVLGLARDEADLLVKRNAPYGPEDGVTHTLKQHGLPRGLLNVMFEIRNTLVTDPDGQDAIAALLSDLITKSLDNLTDATSGSMAQAGERQAQQTREDDQDSEEFVGKLSSHHRLEHHEVPNLYGRYVLGIRRINFDLLPAGRMFAARPC